MLVLVHLRNYDKKNAYSSSFIYINIFSFYFRGYFGHLKLAKMWLILQQTFFFSTKLHAIHFFSNFQLHLMPAIPIFQIKDAES